MRVCVCGFGGPKSTLNSSRYTKTRRHKWQSHVCVIRCEKRERFHTARTHIINIYIYGCGKLTHTARRAPCRGNTSSPRKKAIHARFDHMFATRDKGQQKTSCFVLFLWNWIANHMCFCVIAARNLSF